MIWSALGEGDGVFSLAMQSGHHLAIGIKGQLVDPGRLPLQFLLVHAQQSGQLHQSDFRRVAHPLTALNRGVAAQSQALCQQNPGGRLTQRLGFDQGFIAIAMGDRHFVLRQRARFIGAHHSNGPQGLHRGKPPHNGAAFGQALDAQS